MTSKVVVRGETHEDSCELDVDFLRYESLFERLSEKALEGGAAARPVVQRELINVHADERIRVLAIEPTAELLRVLDRGGSMVECVRDAVAKHF